MADRYLSIPYLSLRVITAGSALIFGLVQTFVFARVLSPERFSIFILIGTLGVTLWLLDFGLTRILFVLHRDAFLAKRQDRGIAEQAAAIFTFYLVMAVIGALACFGIIMARGGVFGDALELSLFFLFVSLNLSWFVLRFICIAVEQFIFFEAHEVIRRFGHIALMLAVLIGLPFSAFLIAANLVWAGLLVSTIRRLVQHGALAWPSSGLIGSLKSFYRANKSEAKRTFAFSAADFYLTNFPYALVPIAFGLGTPTIILDTAFKVYRGSVIVYAAGADAMVPRQTRALAVHDSPALLRTTLIAAGLCGLPAIIACGLLIFFGDWLFAILLGPVATMPPATIPILVVLLVFTAIQTVANSLLLHTGYFKALASVAFGSAIAMTIAAALVVLIRPDIVTFLAAYAGVYAITVVFSILTMIWGPLRAAQRLAPKT